MKHYGWLLPLLAAASIASADFKPALVGAEVTPVRVRPGGQVRVVLRFRNAGDSAADRPYVVFLHFEDPAKGCTGIAWQHDHESSEPVPFWRPGEVVIDGPMNLVVPEKATDGTYNVHVGLFDPAGGERVLDQVGCQLVVDSAAPQTGTVGPEPLSAATAASRADAAAARVKEPVTVAGTGFRFRISPGTGAWLLEDTRAGARWFSNPLSDRFGTLLLRQGKQIQPVVVRDLKPVKVAADGAVLAQELRLPGGAASGLTLQLRFTALKTAPGGLEMAYEALGTSPWTVERFRILDGALPATETGGGRTVYPHRLGQQLTAATDVPTQVSGLTYSGATMQMLSIENDGASLLVSWDDVDVWWQTRLLWLDHPLLAGRRSLLHTVDLSNRARRVALCPLGRGDYVTAARAYREVARRNGWYLPRAELVRQRPIAAQMAGAADFKPFVFVRTVANSVWNKSGKEQVHVGHTFDETGAMADHWRQDLAIDRAMVVLAGWINGGYDNRHPDILPAAPECGGNEALTRAAARIRGCGYLFGLHDNYQDMYEDAPSFSHAMLRKEPSGKSAQGGNWAGGQAWQVRPQDQLKLAQRNLPEVKRLFGPTAYFIDTVFAWGLVDSQFAGDRWDRNVDLEYKSKLCAYARDLTGVFGSEEGREWAVPVSDYLEGLLGHKYDTAPGVVRPIFLITYHDCVSTYTHQSTRIGPNDAHHVLDTLIYAEMPVYEFGSHLYWQRAESEAVPVRVTAEVKPVDGRQFDITYRWQATARPTVDATCFVHFTHPKSQREGIAFQNDHALPKPLSQWQPGETVVDGPHRVTVPAGEYGEFRVELGLLSNGSRLPLAMRSSGGGRYAVGRVLATRDGLRFEPEAGGTQAQPFARKEGWPKELGTTDRFIKNTYEVLSWTHRLTFGQPFEEHRVDGGLEQTRFGNDLRIAVNYGAAERVVDTGGPLGKVTLPQDGFVVWSPTFVAVHATAAAGRAYPTGVLFTARSLDDRPLATSRQVRIYHGCGGPELQLGGRTLRVEREAVVALRD